MPILAKPVFMLAVVLPAAALADPVTVTTRSSGTTTPDNTIMSAFGLDSVPTGAALAYELTLTSTFDSDDRLARDLGLNYAGKVVVDYRIGDQVYRYEGVAASDVDRSSVSVYDSYQHALWFDFVAPEASFKVRFDNALYYLPGSAGQAGPLTPFDASEKSSEHVFGHSSVRMYPGNPDVPLSWAMDGTVAAVSVHVAAVPAPAQYALLAAGVLTLFLRRRSALPEASLPRSGPGASSARAGRAPDVGRLPPGR